MRRILQSSPCNTPSDLPSTGVPDTLQSCGPRETEHLHLCRRKPLPSLAQSQQATCCPLPVHRGPRGPTLTSTQDGLARLEASSHDATLSRGPPTTCVLDGDLGGPQH